MEFLFHSLLSVSPLLQRLSLVPRQSFQLLGKLPRKLCVPIPLLLPQLFQLPTEVVGLISNQLFLPLSLLLQSSE
jgi:hypothetical protein